MQTFEQYWDDFLGKTSPSQGSSIEVRNGNYSLSPTRSARDGSDETLRLRADPEKSLTWYLLHVFVVLPVRKASSSKLVQQRTIDPAIALQ